MPKRLVAAVLALFASSAAAEPVPGPSPATGGYAIVVSKATDADPAWQRVVAALQAKYPNAAKVVYAEGVSTALADLKAKHPRYTCFVATPAEASRQFVADVSRLTRKYDDDPYPDTIWGILTGFDAENARAIAAERQPLTVRKAAAGTEISLPQCEQGKWFCELAAGKQVEKAKAGEPTERKGPTDSTALLVSTLNDYAPDLFITSGHATERNWQIGFRYANGYFVSKAGQLLGRDTAKQLTPVKSDNPKVYLAVGNCLMGHIDGPDAMALAWMRSAGVRQMVGYTVETWYGYAGWGLLDYFVEQPGRYSAAEAFAANQLALSHRLGTYFPDLVALEPKPGQSARVRAVGEAAARAGLKPMDGTGLLHDRDVVAFYGDPGWDARMADAPRAYEQALTRDGDVYTLTIKPNRGAESFAPVNKNGAQRGGRPVVALLPHRIGTAELTTGGDLSPVVGDDFVLVPNPGTCDPGRAYVVTFKAPAR